MTALRTGAHTPAEPFSLPGLTALRLLFATVLALLLPASEALAAKNFPVDQFSYYLSDYDYQLSKIAKDLKKTDLEIQADLTAAETAGNARLAAASIEQLLTRRPTDAALWLSLAEKLAQSTPLDDSDGYNLPSKQIGAALKAYTMLKKAPDEARALVLAADALAKRESWRPALTAYKESLRLVENQEVRDTYEQMRVDHGFRVTDYKVDNDAVPPRACFEMSEPVSRTVTDFTSYFTQSNGPVSAVTAEANKLCVEGLKYGERYTITARQGLPAAVDDTMAKDFSFDFYVRDRNASVRFASKSYVLPRTGQNGIPLISVNSKEAKLSLYRIGDRNLINTVMNSDFRQQITGYTGQDIRDQRGKLVWEGTMETPAPLNEDFTTAFPVDEAMGKLEPGLYVMTASPGGRQGEDYDNVATQWFVVSDLGLSTMSGKDGLRVNVRSIATADAVADAEVRLIARNNEILGVAKSDASGDVLFDAGLMKGEGGDAPALVVAQSAQSDYSFVDLTQPAFDLTDRGVQGRAPSGPVDAFVYAERGVYRRGETVHATVLLRNDKAEAMDGLPVTLVVERPDGVTYLTQTLKDQGAGGHSYDFDINSAAQGGTWRIKALTDPNGDAIGETSFLVEDYIPDRIEFDLKSTTAAATVGEGANLTVDGRYLFGAPGAGLDIEGNLAITADDKPFADWKDYSFGLMDERPDTVQQTLSGLPQTDISGHADIHIQLPDLPVTTHALKADIAIRMREPGGRAVERTVSLPIATTQTALGIKAMFDYGAPEGQPAAFKVIAVGTAGKLVEVKGATWTLKRLVRDWQWFNSDGSWRWESVTRTSKIANGTLDISGSTPTDFAQTLSWGQYRLEIGAEGTTPVSYDFSAGYWYSDSATAETPDTLKLGLDKTDVKAGDTITVKLDARYAGKATVQVVGEKLLASQTVDVPEGGLTVPFTVGSDWGTGAYVLASLYKPMDVKAKRMPARAMGVAWFGIDRAARTLDVTLAAPGMAKPRQPMKVPVKIGNLAAGEEAFITVAAVDVGILNLTRYNPPAPENYYYDQKRLSAELRDIYGLLIDGMQGERGKLRTGGDGGAAFNAPPPAQKPLALYSGIVKVGPDGTVSVDFDIPAFNGTVRVMAVAWSKTKVGHASSDVIVRDPVVVAGTLPRFLAVGDASQLRFDIVNAEAPAGEYTLGVSIDGPVKPAAGSEIQKVTLAQAGARTTVIVPVTATGPGVASVVASLKGPGDILLEQDFALGVLPANPLVTRRTTMPLFANGSITLSKDLVADMVPGTASVALSISPLPQLDAAGLVRDLGRYPYGCSEQTVSRALPLLYLSELGVDQKEIDGELHERMKQAVARLVNRQTGSGSFGLWSSYGDDANLWLSAFVTDFLLRAREKGFDVPEDTLVMGLDYLRNMVGNAPDIEQGAGQDMAYAMYVLARAGRAPVGDIKYLVDTKLKDFGSPLARAQMGAALAILGDRERADTAFASAIEALGEDVDNANRGYYRADYGSTLRDSAAILALATDAKARPDVIRTAMSAVEVERARSSYVSTQEMSWMVLASLAIREQAKTITLDFNGKPQAGALNKVFRDAALAEDVRVTNTGKDGLRAVVSVSGSPVVPEPVSSNGLTLERKYFTTDGQPADIANVKQNTRLVAVLTVSKTTGEPESGNYLLVDKLPAGFEIENPTLVASGGTNDIPWLTDTTYASYTEFRDDRFVASFTNSTAKLAYMVRAVSPGSYIHPGATVEEMYRPEINARGATGTVTVTAP